MENRGSELEEAIAAATTDYSRLIDLTREKEEVETQIEQKLERFLELQEMVDRYSQ